jgi:hypothetical protein
MSEAVPLFPLYAFLTWIGKLPLFLRTKYLTMSLRGVKTQILLPRFLPDNRLRQNIPI